MSDDNLPAARDPHDDLAERAVLGALLIQPSYADQVAAHVTAGDFYRPDHATIYTTIIDRAAGNRPVDAVLIAQDLAAAGVLGRLDKGAGYLHTCIQQCGSPSFAGHYAKIIAGHATTRRVMAISTELATLPNIDDPGRQVELIAAIQGRLGVALASAKERANGTRIRLTAASSFRMRPVRWLWDQRMPLGEITLIPGREGVGKSTCLAWLAAALTNGNLPGVYHGEKKAVLYAASEDAWDYTIAPRMLAAGADLDLVYRIDVEAPDGTIAGLSLPKHTAYLPEVVGEVDAAVLMCDPILNLVDTNINTFKAHELRQALIPLKEAAEAAAISVAALVHFNKGQGGDVGTLIAGARAWPEVARAVIAIAQDKQADEYTCVISQTKNNLGRTDLPNLAYTIQSVRLETDEGPTFVGRLHMLGETDLSVEELLVGTEQDERLSDNTLAVVEYVDNADGPVTAAQAVEAFDGQIPAGTVRKILLRCAKRKLIVSQSRGQYESVKKRKRGGNRAQRAQDPESPLYPPVQMSNVSYPQVRGDMDRVQKADDRVASVQTKEADVDWTLETLDRGDVRARARTREGKIHTPNGDHLPGRELTTCSVCYGPLDDVDRLGRHPTCEPPPDPEPPPDDEPPPTPQSDEDDEPEGRREWYR